MYALWQHIMKLGAAHGVNPWIFAVLYLVHHPLFWGTVAWLMVRFRAKKPVLGVIFLALFFWFLPYAYIFVFGRGLPFWAYAVAAVFASVGGTHVWREIRRRLQCQAE